MSSWLDRWARRAAEATPSAAQDAVAPSRPAPAASRRDFLKKAGIVGGVAWSVPVLQTVMAPAASASYGTALGGTCTGTGACNNGLASCFNNSCGSAGAPVPGGCPSGGLSATGCLSGKCNNGTNLCKP